MSRNDQRVVQAWSNPSCTQQIWHRHTAELGQGANSTCSKSVILSLTLMVETWMRGGPPKETCNWNLRPCHGEVRCVYSISIYIYIDMRMLLYMLQLTKRKNAKYLFLPFLSLLSLQNFGQADSWFKTRMRRRQIWHHQPAMGELCSKCHRNP